MNSLLWQFLHSGNRLFQSPISRTISRDGKRVVRDYSWDSVVLKNILPIRHPRVERHPNNRLLLVGSGIAAELHDCILLRITSDTVVGSSLPPIVERASVARCKV